MTTVGYVTLPYSNSEGSGSVLCKAYSFTYDSLKRLKESDQRNYTIIPWLNDSNFAKKFITYDLNGNIKTLVCTDNAGGTVANFLYTYNGTQLANINGSQFYSYDMNGNAMDIRGFSIYYNLLNLPSRVLRGSESISYIYSAQGEKLAKRMKDGFYTYYAGNMVYKNDKSLNYLLTPRGWLPKHPPCLPTSTI